jgi:TM2 domain-containing membrane protein YozV
MLNKPKDRKIAAALAFAGIVLPGLHKFYLGQPKWGIVYLLLCWTPIPKFASVAEGFWYLLQDREEFEHTFNAANPASSSSDAIAPAEVGLVAEALRQIEQLRQDGLMSEYEFEQKRRQLLDRIG